MIIISAFRPIIARLYVRVITGPHPIQMPDAILDGDKEAWWKPLILRQRPAVHLIT